MPRARVVRRHEGAAYFNLTLSAQREAEHTALEPLTLQVNGAPLALAKVEKAGLFGGLKAGRSARRMETLLGDLAAQRGEAVEQARAWHDRIRDYRWTQAEILQIMEEIEPTTAAALVAWLGSRLTILSSTNRLQRLAALPAAETLALLEAALGAIDGVTEVEMARQIGSLAAQATPELRSWAASDAVGDPAPLLAAAGLAGSWERFLESFGHRSLNMGELAEARWNEDPAPLLRLLANPPAAPAAPDAQALGRLLSAVAAGERKTAQAAVETLRRALVLESGATDALAWLLAGARRWTAGAAREANADQRILALDDVYLFELEELKQMMTNEWNTSDSKLIQGKAESRKEQVALWRAATAPDLLIGDSAADAVGQPDASPLLDPVRWYAASLIDAA
jgi:pyruvate,water dikinase